MNIKLKYEGFFKKNTGIAAAFFLCLVFLVISLFSIRDGATILWLIPPALLIILLAVVNIEKYLFLTVLLVPVSVQLIFIVPEAAADIFLPTELMLAGILILMLFKLIIFREADPGISGHPLSVIILCILTWSFVTSLTSTLPVVSLKSFITKLWFIAGFYLLAAHVFRKTEKVRSYFLLYILGMIPVIFYYLTRMWQAGIFNQKKAYLAIRPFFNDHTSFGAALAFTIPIILYFIMRKGASGLSRILFTFFLFLFLAAFLFSYSRAAWLSLIIAGLAAGILILKISWKILLPLLLAGLVILFISWPQIMMNLGENRQDSSDNIERHIQSISNIRSDASNLERVNRWKSALRMFSEKPFFGWGPATYQFNYAPYQLAAEKTIISTNYGEGGNAHSEYLGSLVDSGVPGLLLYIILIVVSIWRGIIIWKTHADIQIRYLALALTAGIITYAVHGALNNFLDTDKISALFWGMIAAIVSIDAGQKTKAGGERIISDPQ